MFGLPQVILPVLAFHDSSNPIDICLVENAGCIIYYDPETLLYALLEEQAVSSSFPCRIVSNSLFIVNVLLHCL